MHRLFSFVSIMFFVCGICHGGVIWSESFESEDLGQFTDCPENPDGQTWAVLSDPDYAYCGNMPSSGTFYAIGDSGDFGSDKRDIMWTGPISLTATTGKIECLFDYVANHLFWMFHDELYFYATASEPSDPCDPNDWTEMLSVITSDTCLSGSAQVDLTSITGCPANVDQIWIGFGYAGSMGGGVFVDNIRINDTLTCPTEPGEDCSNPWNLTCGGSLSGNLTSYANNYSDTDYGCGSGQSYGGADTVFRLTVAQQQDVTVTLNDNANAAMDLFVTDGCPGGTCLGWNDDTVALTGITGTVYIFVDCPAGSEAAFSLTATCQSVSGEDCSSPLPIQCGDCVCGTTQGMVDDFSCEFFAYLGADVVYELTVDTAQYVTVAGEADYFASWAIGSACSGDNGDVLCDEYMYLLKPSCSTLDSETNPPLNFTFWAVPGSYYIWVDSDLEWEAGNYCLEVFCGSGDDCAGAIPMACADTVTYDPAAFTSTIDSATYGAFALGDGQGPDIWFHLGTYDENTQLDLSVTANDLYLLNGCGTCIASGDLQIRYVTDGTEDLYAVVDSNASQGGAAFDLSMTCQPLSSGFTIGSVTCDDHNPDIPFGIFNDYYETQYCIPAFELQDAGLTGDFEISTMSWYLCQETVAEDINNTVDIWLANVISGCPDVCMMGEPNGVQVVSGQSFFGSPGQWISFNLDTPFVYEAGKGLMISVCDSTGGTQNMRGAQWAINWDLSHYWAVSKEGDDAPLDCDLTTDVPADPYGCFRYWTTLGVDGMFVPTPTPALTPATPTVTATPTAIPTIRPGTDCDNLYELLCNDCLCDRSYGYGQDHDCESGWGHDGPDVVYHLYLPSYQEVRVIGEANFDADWAIATTCSSSAADIICADQEGDMESPSCSTVDGYTWGYFDYTFSADGDIYIWVDGEMESTFGSYCIEVLCEGAPSPTPTATPTATSQTPSATPTSTPATPTSTPTPLPGNTCSNPIEISSGTCLCDSTDGYSNDHDCTFITPLEGHAGPDKVYHLYLAETKLLQVIAEADFDADWTVATECSDDAGDLACKDWAGIHADPVCSSLTHEPWGFINSTFVATGDIYIWVDAFKENTTGNYCLEIFTSDPPTATPEPSVTPTPNTGILELHLELERPGTTPPHASWNIPVTIELCSGGTVVHTATTSTNTSGDAALTLAAGTFDVLIKHSHSLKAKVPGVTIPLGGSSGVITCELFEGDADGDNNVLSGDFFILRSAYNSSSPDPNFDPRADFNVDGMVTSTDFFLLRSHYNQAGAECE